MNTLDLPIAFIGQTYEFLKIKGQSLKTKIIRK